MRKKLTGLIIMFFISAMSLQAQYNKEKVIDILTEGSTKTWSVKGINIELPEKSYTFNKNGSILIQTSGSSKPSTWQLKTPDNIRWLITIAGKEHELIISFDKTGKQYIKLTYKATGKTSVYYETLLYPINK